MRAEPRLWVEQGKQHTIICRSNTNYYARPPVKDTVWLKRYKNNARNSQQSNQSFEILSAYLLFIFAGEVVKYQAFLPTGHLFVFAHGTSAASLLVATFLMLLISRIDWPTDCETQLASLLDVTDLQRWSVISDLVMFRIRNGVSELRLERGWCTVRHANLERLEK